MSTINTIYTKTFNPSTGAVTRHEVRVATSEEVNQTITNIQNTNSEYGFWISDIVFEDGVGLIDVIVPQPIIEEPTDWEELRNVMNEDFGYEF